MRAERARVMAARRAAAEERRKAEQAEKAKKKEERKKALLAIRNGVMGYFGAFICVLFIICGIALTLYLFELTDHKNADPLPEKIVYNIGEEKTTLAYSSVYINEKYYVDLSSIAARALLSVSGDSKNMILSTPTGEKAVFNVDSASVSINGVSVSMDAPCFLREGKLWVSADFVNKYINGVTVSVSEDKKSLTVDISDNCTFLLKSEAPLAPPIVDKLPPASVILPADTPRYEFISDLSSYYKYMDPEDRDAFLVLINSANPVSNEYVPADLVNVLNVKKGETNIPKMSLNAEKALEALFVEMYAEGYTNVIATAGYRTFEAQKKQFDVYVYNETYYYRTNYEKTGKWFSDTAYAVLGKSYLDEKYVSKGKTVLSADDARRVVQAYYDAPGMSDHQTGLSCHLRNLSSTLAKFENEGAYEWLLGNAHKFGFVLRYPKEKEKITGVVFEAYHWRFVGQYHAAVMYENGFCLEEYVAMLNKGQ